MGKISPGADLPVRNLPSPVYAPDKEHVTPTSPFHTLVERFDKLDKALATEPVVDQIKIRATFVGTGGTDVVDIPSQFQPLPGYMWSIRRFTIAGFTAGTIVVSSSDGGEPLIFYSVPAANPYARGAQLIDGANERLIVTGTGITGTMQIWGRADVFPAWYLKKYLS